jgi:serpin B
LWGQTGFAFEAPFLDTLATEFGAGLQLVDYEKDPEAARQLINAWVNTKTQQRIPELIPQGPITVDTRLTLVNAIYMKAPWLKVFAKDGTRPAPFTTIGGSVVQAPMMHLTEDLAFATGSGWQAVELPYMGEDLSMLIVLPDADTSLADAVAALALVSGVASTRKVKLSLPKFDIETSTELAPLLAAMGMPSAFSDTADFSGMTTATKLTIAAVIHQANITVDEDGTEAAAATAVVIRATAAPEPQEPVELLVNRPFVFAIRDNPTGAVLFVGHIGDPTATRT